MEVRRYVKARRFHWCLGIFTADIYGLWTILKPQRLQTLERADHLLSRPSKGLAKSENNTEICPDLSSRFVGSFWIVCQSRLVF